MPASPIRTASLAALALFCAATGAAAETKAERKARILAPTTDFTAPERFELYQGGSGTNRAIMGRDAFSQPSAILTFEQQGDFHVGNGIFDRMWVSAPSSTIAHSGSVISTQRR